MIEAILFTMFSILLLQYAYIFLAIMDKAYKGEIKELKRDLIPYMFIFIIIKSTIVNLRQTKEEYKEDKPMFPRCQGVK